MTMPAASRMVILCLGLTLCAAPATAQISGRIVRVGLSAGGASLVRDGDWTFVEVTLSWAGPQPFSGFLEVQQPDRDGDIARHQTNVALGPGERDHRFSIYFTPNTRGMSDVVRVRLYDVDRRLLTIADESNANTPVDALISSPLSFFPGELGLILDLSEPPLSLLAYRPEERAESGSRAPREGRWQTRSLDPRSVPDCRQGLELADVIVWDDADTTILTPAQLDALIDWVRYGGRLVISASRNWQTLAQSPLADILPVKVVGLVRVDEVQEFSQKILSDEEHDLDAFYAAHPVARCEMAILPGALSVPSNPSRLAGLNPIAFRRLVGRGTVTFVGASLRELLTPILLPRADMPKPAKGALDPQQAVRDKARQTQRALIDVLIGAPRGIATGEAMFDTLSLFDIIRATVGFQAVSVLYVLIAVIFAISYSFIATFGSFLWLRRRSALHQSWSAFAVVALAATVVGTLSVWWLRGITTRLEQATIVDAQANSSRAIATAMFGVKTPSHSRFTPSLPVAGLSADEAGGAGSVRVLPLDPRDEMIDSTYVAPMSYPCVGNGLSVHDIPIRATLKELEGCWEGQLPGRLEGQLIRDARGFAGGTFIRNRLTVDLHHCYLVETPSESAVRAFEIRCYALPDLPAAGSASALDELALNKTFVATGPPKAKSNPRSEPESLQNMMQSWAEGLLSMMRFADGSQERRLDSGESAMLLLSFMELYDPDRMHPNHPQSMLWRTNGRRLDCSHQLTRDTAILLAFSDAPPPVVLHYGERGRNELRPYRCSTLYRFVIPIRRS